MLTIITKDIRGLIGGGYGTADICPAGMGVYWSGNRLVDWKRFRSWRPVTKTTTRYGQGSGQSGVISPAGSKGFSDQQVIPMR